MEALTFVSKPADDVRLCVGEPEIEVHHDCVYVPLRGGNFWTNKNWGIFDAQGRLIDAAAYRAAPGMGLTGQNETCLVDIADASYAPADEYFYVGNIIPHYGHFICSSMSRLWALPQCGGPSIPLIGHAEGHPEHWFNSSVVRSLFGVANVIRDDFAQFDRPTRLKKLIIPRAAFIEKNLAYREFAKAAHGWGDRLVKTVNLTSVHDILYISKSRHKASPDGLSNESEITDFVSSRGYRVVYPEQLSLPEQVALFRSHRILIGQVGSAFHTSIFSEPLPGQKIINITLSFDVYSSNHALIDLANRNNTTYVHLRGEYHAREGANPGFRIENPRQAAELLLELAHSRIERPATSCVARSL